MKHAICLRIKNNTYGTLHTIVIDILYKLSSVIFMHFGVEKILFLQ